MKADLCDVCLAKEYKMNLGVFVYSSKSNGTTLKVVLCSKHKNYMSDLLKTLKPGETIEKIEAIMDLLRGAEKTYLEMFDNAQKNPN